MAFTKNDLIDRVSAKIDEVLPPVEGEGASAYREASVNYIEEVLDEAAKFILRNAPIVMVKQVVKKADKHFPIDHPDVPAVNPDVALTYDVDTGISIVPCPVDFARFVNIKLSDWTVQATEMIPEEDPKYRFMKGNTIFRGTAKKPKAAVIAYASYAEDQKDANFQNTGLAVECFSSKEAPTLTQFMYIPSIPAEKMPIDLIDATCWEAAARTLKMMKEDARAKEARQEALNYFDNKFGIVGGR